VEVISRVWPLKKQGKDYWASCPFHADNSPSFSVVPAKQIYHCFGCPAHGDVFSFWMNFHKISFPEAARAIASMYGLTFDSKKPIHQKKKYPELPKSQKAWSPEERPEPCDLWKQKAMKFTVWAYERLFEHPEQLQYLASRGIKEETIGKYGLGWNPKDIYRPRQAWGLPEILGDNGKPRRLWLPMGLVIPCISNQKEVVKLRIRRPDPLTFAKNTRYYFVPGGSTITTVLHPGRRAHVVVESDLDGLLIDQEAGDLVGTVILGSASAKPDVYATQILKDSLHILNALDYDKAGAEQKRWWKDNFKNSIRWPVAAGKDQSDMWAKGVNVRDWVRAGLPEGLR
jgi:DNA primase